MADTKSAEERQEFDLHKLSLSLADNLKHDVPVYFKRQSDHQQIIVQFIQRMSFNGDRMILRAIARNISGFVKVRYTTEFNSENNVLNTDFLRLFMEELRQYIEEWHNCACGTQFWAPFLALNTELKTKCSECLMFSYDITKIECIICQTSDFPLAFVCCSGKTKVCSQCVSNPLFNQRCPTCKRPPQLFGFNRRMKKRKSIYEVTRHHQVTLEEEEEEDEDEDDE
jgi:hypothetical protein